MIEEIHVINNDVNGERRHPLRSSVVSRSALFKDKAIQAPTVDGRNQLVVETHGITVGARNRMVLQDATFRHVPL